MFFSIKVTILSDTRYLILLRDLIEAVCKVVGRAEFSEDVKWKCQIALVEAVNNAIFHAHKGEVSKPIDILIDVGEDAVRLQVADRGDGFNLVRRSLPPLLEEDGRGLYLMSELMGSVENHILDGRHFINMSYSFKGDNLRVLN